MKLQQQCHGYRRGHQLLASTLELDARDQELIDKLSDASGSPRPGERFEPYLTIYPLPSDRFQVVARTWQDLAAPRSGTVFTRSLLVPMADWRAAVSLRPLFEALDDREVTGGPVVVEARADAWPPVDDPNLSELTEALFLERSSAVAAFGFNATETIAGRLLEALWPSRRAAMAVCTYALAPRALSNRDFDLIFAPETARPRYAKWGGRRVDAKVRTAPARHQWTALIIERVFHDATPSLRDLDEVGALDTGGRSDGSSLRLALLWTDLKESAAHAPTSILGMLDVLSSLRRSPWALPYFPSLVARALDQAAAKPAPEAWQFLQLLVRKLDAPIPIQVVRHIFAAARILARHAPYVVTTNAGADAQIQALPHLLRPGIGDGLAALDEAALSDVLRSIEPALLLSLMAESPRLAYATTAALADDANPSLTGALAHLIAGDQRAARRLAAGVARAARTSAVEPLLRAVLRSAPCNNFGRLARDILAANEGPRPAILDLLVETARACEAQGVLRTLALEAPSATEGQRLLVTLISTRADVAWLIDATASNPNRLASLLLELVARWSDADLADVAVEGRNRDALFVAAVDALPQSIATLVRLLRLVPPSPTKAAAMLRHALPRLSPRDGMRLSIMALDQLFALEPESVHDLVAPLLSAASPSDVIAAATSSQLRDRQVGRNIAVIAASPAAPRYGEWVELLTWRLIDRRSGDYGREGYEAWAALLREAMRRSPDTLRRCADAALDYALARPREPAGAVVAAAFPVVHARLKSKGAPLDFGFNPLAAIMVASLGLFTDWDRAKSARHDVVEAFLHSDWEPAELLRAAMDAGVCNKMLDQLVSRPNGEAYLRKIERSLARYPKSAGGRLAAALRDYMREAR